MTKYIRFLIPTLAFLIPYAHAAKSVPFTVEEALDIMGIKRWKHEHIYREPAKGVQVAIITGRSGPDGVPIETQMPTPFGYQTPSRQTRFVVGVILIEDRRVFRTMIDNLAAEVSMPTDFRYDYESMMPNGIIDGDLLILAYTAKKQGEAIKSKYQLKSYFAIKITPIR